MPGNGETNRDNGTADANGRAGSNPVGLSTDAALEAGNANSETGDCRVSRWNVVTLFSGAAVLTTAFLWRYFINLSETAGISIPQSERYEMCSDISVFTMVCFLLLFDYSLRRSQSQPRENPESHRLTTVDYGSIQHNTAAATRP
jgi:hypothetical protein